MGRCNIIYSNRYLEGGVYETVWTSRAELGGESQYVVESRVPREGDRASLGAQSRVDPWSVGNVRRGLRQAFALEGIGADVDRTRGHFSRDRLWRIWPLDRQTGLVEPHRPLAAKS